MLNAGVRSEYTKRKAAHRKNEDRKQEHARPEKESSSYQTNLKGVEVEVYDSPRERKDQEGSTPNIRGGSIVRDEVYFVYRSRMERRRLHLDVMELVW